MAGVTCSVASVEVSSYWLHSFPGPVKFHPDPLGVGVYPVRSISSTAPSHSTSPGESWRESSIFPALLSAIQVHVWSSSLEPLTESRILSSWTESPVSRLSSRCPSLLPLSRCQETLAEAGLTLQLINLKVKAESRPTGTLLTCQTAWRSPLPLPRRLSPREYLKQEVSSGQMLLRLTVNFHSLGHTDRSVVPEPVHTDTRVVPGVGPLDGGDAHVGAVGLGL